MKSRLSRAKPMAAADRRRAILNFAVPLLLRKGASVTTAEMAQAAGIAEGTLFRAFPDKPALLFEAVKAAMDPARLTEAIRAIDTRNRLELRLAEAADLLRDYFNRVTTIAESLRAVSTHSGARQKDVVRLIRESSATITAALTTLFESHRGELRVPPAAAVGAFRGLVLASAHPLLPPHERLATGEVVSILMSGIAVNSKD